MSVQIAVQEPDSTLTCPEFGHQSTDLMPSDACQFFYDCQNCSTLLKPNTGACCVYCSFVDVKCPPAQANSSCCA
ncbi:GDCCVxC domain-containing (seleno)protein [Dokdonella sp.]|uniref:GDCCVxC domain-containing (seleno)protein n=1 Tax=Dokdonella sp. TaxID=2291710 RepID=UPI003527BBA2